MGIFVPLSTPAEELPLIFVDVETTGLHAALGDRVCEIALLRVEHGREVARFESLVQPRRPMAPGATTVNGITDAMLVDAPPFADLIPRLQALLHHCVFVAHNALFDVGFLRHEFHAAGHEFPPLPVVDTLALAQAHYRFSHNSLEAIATELGVPGTTRHRAMPDVLTTHAVLTRFITDLCRQGPVTLAHLMYPSDRRSADELTTLTTTLHDALRTGTRLHIRYQAGNAAQTTRVVQPLEMNYERGHSYLRAFCHLRQDERNFRLDRIVDVKIFSEE